jgi:hypothetical protein
MHFEKCAYNTDVGVPTSTLPPIPGTPTWWLIPAHREEEDRQHDPQFADAGPTTERNRGDH